MNAGVHGGVAASVEELYEDAPCGHVSTAADGTILRANRTLLAMLGRRSGEVVGRMTFADLLAPGSRLYLSTHLMPLLLLRGTVAEISLELVDASGRRLPVLAASVLRRDASGVPAAVHTALFEAPGLREHERELRRVRDELAQRNDELRRAAYTDPLTRVANRRAVEEQLERAVSRARRHGTGLGVALVDIDHFKRVNDTFGHQEGDAILHAVARRLEQHVRREDVVGRWGGEEFVVLAPDTSPDGMPMLAERLRAAIAAAPVETGHGSVPLTVSVGWAEWAGHSPEALLAAADGALYAAKAAGRDAVRGADGTSAA